MNKSKRWYPLVIALNRVSLLDFLPNKFVLFHYPGFMAVIKDTRPGTVQPIQKDLNPFSARYSVAGAAEISLEGPRGILTTILLREPSDGVVANWLFSSSLRMFPTTYDLQAYIDDLRQDASSTSSLFWTAEPINLQVPSLVTFKLTEYRHQTSKPGDQSL